MAVVAVPFTHFDLTCAPGDVIPDDDPLVAIAPHLFDASLITPEPPDPAASAPESDTTGLPTEVPPTDTAEPVVSTEEAP